MHSSLLPKLFNFTQKLPFLTLPLLPLLLHFKTAQKSPNLLLISPFSSIFENNKDQREEKFVGFEEMGGSKDGSVEDEQGNSNSIDVNDYVVVKEGEAEILMHNGNQVFFNRTQVNNRDISIAVLRTYIDKRKQEHEAYLSKKAKGAPKRSEEKTDAPASVNGPVESKADSHTSNGVHDNNVATDGKPEDASCETVAEPSKTVVGKFQRELKPPRLLEALSASGLRALRYAREVEGLGQIVALDNDKASVEACQRNIKFNGSVASSKVESNFADARVYMLTHPKEFEVVDLDPYGSPSVFLDSAIQSVVDGGMLMCTATDMAVLCGGNAEVCYSKYNSIPLKAKYCHEMALRILLASIESHANRYKRYIVPILSVRMDFYIRVFVRIYSSASIMKETPLKLSYVYQCVGCDSFHLQPLGRSVSKNNNLKYYPGYGPVVPQECSDCGKRFNMGGPIWSAPIHDQEWVTSILSDVKAMKDRYPAYDKIVAVLTTVSEELPDVPLFLCLHNLCGTLKCTSPAAVIFRSAVLNAGYRISGTHASPLGLKTDAPMSVIWDIMRCWVKNHPVKPQPADQSGTVILSKEPEIQANFTRAVASLSKAQAKKVARFLPNPERYWGPKVRGGRQITSKHVSLLGPEAINGSANHDEEEGEESDAKRQKIDNHTSDS
ncbi:probable tRNA (guanine(26)-N(2))-dimethyltransferase 1 isoform X1 [Chenopodium quinoa]|uniref:tRNA (guanine(26)-N(2))-dimethyltransferase n=1 Tax=Chenopodium quinoa TaxID=63459 RepID=A0A803LC99_CHEQI|nr:probable tRNA (guanine(26)-N(2))-dimethyltransferase 1 isoform X1 [Chenopodium quinoa]